MKKVSCFLLSCFLLPSAVQAIDLEAMQDAAVSNRAVIQRSVADLEKSEEDITLARSGYYPSLDLFYRMNQLDEDGRFEADQNSTAGVRASWNVFAGFRDKYGIESAEQLSVVEQYRLEGVEQDIQLSVALSYLGVYERRANLQVSEDTFTTLSKVYRDGQNRFDVGLIGKNELLQFRVDYDNADITAKAAKAGLDRSVNTLSRTVGLDIGFAELGFQEFDTMPGELNEDDYIAAMLDKRSEIKALEGIILAAESQIQGAYADYYPKVDLVGSYQNYDDDFFNGNGDEQDDEVRGTVNATMNLFQGYSTQAGVTKAKIEKRGLQYDLKELQDTYTNDLRNLFIDYRVSLENVEVARRSIEQAEENLRITQLKYDEGLQRESDLLDAIDNLSRAKYNEVAVIRTLFSNYFQIVRMVNGF